MRHIREIQEAGIDKLTVAEDFLVGRVLAHNIVDKESGEIIANANDEITETLLGKLQKPVSPRYIPCIPTTWIRARSSRRLCARMRRPICGRRVWRSIA